jgi:hypothetical protein
VIIIYLPISILIKCDNFNRPKIHLIIGQPSVKVTCSILNVIICAHFIPTTTQRARNAYYIITRTQEVLHSYLLLPE